MKIQKTRLNELAFQIVRGDFWSYCKIRAPRFFSESKKYLKSVAKSLQLLMSGELRNDHGQTVNKLILNMPPRHGKTRTIIEFCQWVLGNYPETGIMTASYNEALSSRMAKAVRDTIMEQKADQSKIVYSDIFPETRVKAGDSSAQFWAIEGRHFSFLATSPGGTMTGVGAQLLLLDDIVKNADEAFNERVLDNHWDWYTNTVLSRLESGAKQVIIATRWATRDLSGRILELEPEKWKVISMPAMSDDGEMLCPEILDKAEFLDRQTKTDPVIFQSNYQQKPFDSGDKLYPEFKTYTHTPKFRAVESYTDTADKGADFLASCAYGVTEDNQAYVLDLVYTQDGMEKTEYMVKNMLKRNSVDTAHIESNNGGEGFKRNVEKELIREGHTSCHLSSFHQSGNKEARILTNATTVLNCVIMPEDWKTRWPEFSRDVSRMSRIGKWAHDDAADMLTGIVEKSIIKSVSFVF